MKSIRSNVHTFDETRQALEVLDTFVSRVKCSDDDITAAPTSAECTAAFGTTAQVGRGFIGVINDAGADQANKVYLCVSTGTAWFYETLTKTV